MNFELILKTLLEKAIYCFNSGDYDALSDLIVEDIHFIGPEYNNDIIQQPAVEFNSRTHLFAYWKKLHHTYPFTISKHEFLSIGKISRFRSYMDELNFIIDAELHFNEYGKATKIYNKISGSIK